MDRRKGDREDTDASEHLPFELTVYQYSIDPSIHPCKYNTILTLVGVIEILTYLSVTDPLNAIVYEQERHILIHFGHHLSDSIGYTSVPRTRTRTITTTSLIFTTPR
jgi:hypothetical protein